MSLIQVTRQIQMLVGTSPDGIYGPITARAVLRELEEAGGIAEPQPAVASAAMLDDRTRDNLAALHPAAAEALMDFAARAKTVAASFGCDYIAISGLRTYAQQNALYARGRSKPGNRVTKVKGGRSYHNFGMAADFGVFRDGAYLDGSASKADRALAARVHKACGALSSEFPGLEWGGAWKGFVDMPHYQFIPRELRGLRSASRLARLRSARESRASISGAPIPV